MLPPLRPPPFLPSATPRSWSWSPAPGGRWRRWPGPARRGWPARSGSPATAVGPVAAGSAFDRTASGNGQHTPTAPPPAALHDRPSSTDQDTAAAPDARQAVCGAPHRRGQERVRDPPLPHWSSIPAAICMERVVLLGRCPGDGLVAEPPDGQFEFCHPGAPRPADRLQGHARSKGRTMRHRQRGPRHPASEHAIESRSRRCSWDGTGPAPHTT
jgi:hypothetical protein